jgi:hypothetical protein
MSLRTEHDALSTVRDASFVYLGGKIPPAEAEGLGRRTEGLVVRGQGGLRVARSLRMQHGYGGGLVLDPSWYEFDDHRPEPHSFAEEVALQSELQVAAYLSPSRYVPPGKPRALRQTMERGASFADIVTKTARKVPTLTVLPISRYWLTAGLDELVKELTQWPHPIALALADRNDPLNSRRAITGFRTIIESRDNVAVIRSDMAALGAMAHGAFLIAIGTGTSVRHFVPPGQTAGGKPHDHTPSVLVGSLRGYFKGSRLELAKGLDKGLLDCTCPICDGRSLTRFGDARYSPEARLHNAEVAYLMSRHIADLNPRLRRPSWYIGCQTAVDMHEQLEHITGVPFAPDRQLLAWTQLD